jgi:hypothetical protein
MAVYPQAIFQNLLFVAVKSIRLRHFKLKINTLEKTGRNLRVKGAINNRPDSLFKCPKSGIKGFKGNVLMPTWACRLPAFTRPLNPLSLQP